MKYIPLPTNKIFFHHFWWSRRGQARPALSAHLPLRWRLALISLGLLTLLLIPLGLIIPLTQEATLLDSQASGLHTLAYQNILVTTGFGVQAINSIEDWSQFHQVISQEAAIVVVESARKLLGTESSVGVSVITPDGKMIEGNREEPLRPTVSLSTATVKSWFTTKQRYVLANDQKGQREIVVLQPIVVYDLKMLNKNTENKKEIMQHGAIGFLQLNTETAQIDQAIASLRLELMLGIIALLSIASALTLPLLKGALRPLVEMDKASTRIARGELSLRLTVPPAHDEVGQLASSFNTMVARLDEAFARQKRFVADVSHELRTPLTALGGSLEMLLLEADKGDPASHQKLLQGMYSEVERMQHLVSDLLVLSLLDEGQIKLHHDNVNIADLLHELHEQAAQRSYGQHIDCSIPPELPTISGDKEQLRRILLNLLENALKFTPPPGHIELSATTEDNTTLLISIHDTGIGIPPEALPHVFERFYRVDTSRTRANQPGGSGLGLAIAQGLVHAHGGTITITSTIGTGTHVTIKLPFTSPSPLSHPFQA